MLTTFNLKITKHVLITIYYTITGKQDDVTTGRNLALHLNRGDMVRMKDMVLQSSDMRYGCRIVYLFFGVLKNYKA